MITLILLLVLGAIFLSVGLGVGEAKNTEFGNVFITNLIGAILALFLPWFIGRILYWYIIKVRHETDWGGAIIAWFLAWIIPVVIVSVIFIFFALIPGLIPMFPI
nr:hypothetical protein [Candidatus Njordarchaeota archaeon]